MRRISIIILTSIFILLSKYGFSQDPQFSQFYASPLYLGAAFTGATRGSRACLNYRNQWPSLPKAYITTAFSYDRNISKYNSGVGLFVLRDQAGTASLSRYIGGLLYSYNVRVNRRLQVRAGVSFIYQYLSYDYSSMIFGHQIDQLTGTVNIDADKIPLTKHGFFDFSTSAIAYTKRFWGGITIDHLPKPNESLTGGRSIIPVKYTVFGGGKTKINRYVGRSHKQYVIFAFHYKRQEKYDQLDLGAYINRNPLLVGFWYRGLPGVKPSFGHLNHDAVAFMVGYKVKEMQLIYNYDFTISPLINSSGGAHEISIVYLIKQKKKAKKMKAIPCPFD